MNRYSNFSFDLRDWFWDLRVPYPEAHISCAGRGKIEQEALYSRGATRAHWGQSAHNFNLAIDLWENRNGIYTLDADWFHRVVAPRLTASLTWYGQPDAVFKELPHLELSGWKDRVKRGEFKLVE